MVAGKLKEVDMKPEERKSMRETTVVAKFVSVCRRFLGESILGLAAIGVGWTAGAVPLQLSRVA